MRKRYALVGSGARAEMFIYAIAGKYADSAELVGLCDLSQTRMNWYNEQLALRHNLSPRPTYAAHEFDRMIAETKPDVVIVTTMDSTHHIYITRAMELGCDAITEKPMTIDIEKTRLIFDTIQRTGKSLRVCFNYRYAPAFSKFRELIRDGSIGRPLNVDFSWMLDTHHGADYFRRWHREKHNSGGLLVHKATHHFDLVNWWIDSYPKEVFALGDLLFYGKANAEARGEHYPYERYTGNDAAKNDPFALFLDKKDTLRKLYLEAEADSGYVRDRNVFGEPITIEDTMCVTARYKNNVLMTYNLIAYSPWEGLRVAVSGTKGRVELEVVEAVEQGTLQASTGPFKHQQIYVYPMFAAPYEVPIDATSGGHGGADPNLLRQIFAVDPPRDPLKRDASHIDGAASILLGISANLSMATGQLVKVDELFDFAHAQV